jgi:rhodanese-related sulfurtransferase
MVDVRSIEEFKSGHVANSKNLPLADIQDPAKQLHLDTNKPIILVCLSGSRASSAVGKFKKAGFSEIACMEGGIGAWTQAGLPLVQ